MNVRASPSVKDKQPGGVPCLCRILGDQLPGQVEIEILKGVLLLLHTGEN
jgi:hypothetical protein